ncbi:MAG: tetratricopeptide repeat protein [Parachlamydia sp.]|nr:tetratricopeptide repeat protein [Parachlamydia sp.]
MLQTFCIFSVILMNSFCAAFAADFVEEMTQADRLYQATLFDASAEKYIALLQHAPNDELDLKIRSRLIENLYILKRYAEAIQIAPFEAMQAPPSLEQCRLRALFFKGLSHSRLEQEEAAIQALSHYLDATHPSKEFENEARLQLGLIYFERGQTGPATLYFEAVVLQPQNPRIYFQAALHLAKIHLQKGDPQHALMLLTPIENQLPSSDPLRNELAYLSGTCHVQLHNYQQAIAWLDQAKGQDRQTEVLFLSGWARLQNHQMVDAEAIFQTLIAQSTQPELTEKAVLALAQCYLSQSQWDKADKLLDTILIVSHEGKAQALFFKAQTASSFVERERIYSQLTEGPYQNTAIYAEGWFERGLNAFKEGDEHAFDFLQEAIRLLESKDRQRADMALYLTHQLRFRQKKFDEAEQGFIELARKGGPLSCEAILFAAKCADEKGEKDKAREYRRRIFDEYPEAPCAGEAYFQYYAYRDYVQGERAAIKHLQSMPTRFPDSSYLITAHYLIGMDEKRDRKNTQGKWIRKKNMNDSIEALQEVEAIFDKLDAAKKIPQDERAFFINVRYRATLERALANLAIAEESQGAKRQIFLQYAKEVFAQIRNDFSNPRHPLASQLAEEVSPALLEESIYWLAQTHIKSGEDREAEKLLKQMLEHSTKYYLSRAWYELGLIAMRRHDYQKALDHLSQAEKTAGQNLLSADQKIDLWIQQSLCHKERHDLDQAMLLLSQAINDDTISSLRVKAMYLRSEIYALQGRHDLARKQLEATARKGGEWALKAKERLKHDNP